MRAKHRTYCAVCQTIVERGSEIEPMPTGRWGHAGCAEYARNRTLVRSPDGDTYRARYGYRGRA